MKQHILFRRRRDSFKKFTGIARWADFIVGSLSDQNFCGIFENRPHCIDIIGVKHQVGPKP